LGTFIVLQNFDENSLNMIFHLKNALAKNKIYSSEVQTFPLQRNNIKKRPAVCNKESKPKLKLFKT